MSAPYRILCLIDGYPSHVQEGREGAGIGPAMEAKFRTLDQHPGRWSLVAERIRNTGGIRVGTEAKHFSKHGYETTDINGRTYARKPHPSGLPLSSVVAKLPRRHIDPLPAVQSDEFGWSANELHTAVATAKSWLFPFEGTQAA